MTMMSSSSRSAVPYLGLYIAAVLMAAGGWAGLYYLIVETLPLVGPRWLFFVLWLTALTGTSVPFAHYLNRRFSRRTAPAWVLLRQSLWVGIFGAISAWLLIGRTLTWVNGLVLITVLFVIEWLLQLREGSRYSPDVDS